MRTPPAISLPRFEGPLDLLLALVRQHEVAITDIPIAEITRQYLDYLHQAQQLDLDLGSEFTCMAATLIEIKARSLLPRDPAAPDREDPREELVRQLLDHEQLRRATEFLQQKLGVSQTSWSHAAVGELDQTPEDDAEPSARMSLFQVLELAQKALEAARVHQALQMNREPVTVLEMMNWLKPRLPGQGYLFAEPLFDEQDTPERKAALFLAMLEMAKAGNLKIQQAGPFQPIHLQSAAGPFSSSRG